MAVDKRRIGRRLSTAIIFTLHDAVVGCSVGRGVGRCSLQLCVCVICNLLDVFITPTVCTVYDGARFKQNAAACTPVMNFQRRWKRVGEIRLYCARDKSADNIAGIR